MFVRDPSGGVSFAFFLFSMYINDLEETFVLQDF